jgi:hypothetical protein
VLPFEQGEEFFSMLTQDGLDEPVPPVGLKFRLRRDYVRFYFSAKREKYQVPNRVFEIRRSVLP